MTLNKNIAFQDMTDEQKEVVMAYVNLFLQHKRKEQFVANIGKTDLQALASISTAVSFVSKRILEKTKDEPEFQHILDLLKLSWAEKKIAPQLIEIFEERKLRTLDKSRNSLEILRLEILGRQGENYLALSSSEDKSKQQLSQKILKNTIASCHDPKLIEHYQKIEIEIEILVSNADFELSTATLAINSKDFDVPEYLAFLIYKPEHRLMSETYLDPQWENFPLKWANHLGIAETKTLFDMFKDGEDIAPYYIKRFDTEGVNTIRELVNEPITRTPIANSKNHKEIQTAIQQALLCYENKWYAAFLYTILLIIEGILWRYSAYLNMLEEAKIYTAPNSKSVILLSGKIDNEPTIGMLLRKSEFSKFFDLEFIQYFCNELYNERNPMLHGESFSQATMENASKKLATLEYLFVTMRTFMERKIVENFEKLPSDTIKILLETFAEKRSST